MSATSFSFICVLVSGVLVSCGSDTNQTTGAEELTATAGSQRTTKLDGVVQDKSVIPTKIDGTLYEGFAVVCQDGFAKTTNRRGTSEELYKEASAICANRISSSGKKGIAKYSVLQQVQSGTPNKLEHYGIGYTVLCQDGFKKSVALKGLLSDLAKDAELTCKGRFSSATRKEGIAQYAVLPVSWAPSEAVPVSTQPIGYFAQCQDGSVLKKEISTGKDPYSEAQAACKGKRNSVTQKEGLNSCSVIIK